MAAPVIPVWTISDRLRKAREAAGLSQGELAVLMRVSRQTISNYENPGWTRRRQGVVIDQWAAKTGVPVEWIEGRWDGEPDEVRSRCTAMGRSVDTPGDLRFRDDAPLDLAA